MTDEELLSLAQGGSASGCYLFDPEAARAIWVGGGCAEEAPMTLEVAYAMAPLADQGLGGWLVDYFLGFERTDVDGLDQARSLVPERLVPLDRAHVEPAFLSHIGHDGRDGRERMPGFVR